MVCGCGHLLFVNKVLLEHSCARSFKCGRFCATMTVLKSYYRYHGAQQAYNMYFLAFYCRK
jgi:hypothetical protein